MFVEYVGCGLSLLGLLSIWNAATGVLGHDYLFLGFWTIVPPIWFYFEYVFLFDNWESGDAVTHMKYMKQKL